MCRHKKINIQSSFHFPQRVGNFFTFSRIRSSACVFLISLAILPPLETPSHAHEQHTLVDEKTIEATEEISGFPSQQNHVTRQPGNDAILVGIAGAEKRDNPCYMKFTWVRRNDKEHKTFNTRWYNAPCSSDESGDNSYKFVRLAQQDGRFGISSIQVCNNKKSNQRLKGIEIRQVREITENGAVSSSLNVEGEYERTNCGGNWDKVSDCDPGEVAVGVNLYFDDEGATGLELICGAAELQRERVTGPITTPVDPGTQQKSDLSGYAGERTTRVMIGTGVELPNARLRHYGITSIALTENGDRPCHIKLFGRALDWRKTTESRMLGQLKLDRCDKSFPVWTDALTPSLANEGDQFMVGAEVVCNSSNRNNNRIKGLKIYGGEIDENGRITKASSSAQASESQNPENCGDFSRSADVYCRDSNVGSRYAIAVGLEMQHEDDAFTGFKLICRDVMVDEYPALLEDSEGY